VREYEAVDQDEEVAEDNYAVVEGDEEVVDEEEEVVTDDEVVVASPRGDPVLEYVYGLSPRAPPTADLYFPLREYKRLEALSAVKPEYKEHLARLARLIHANCTFKPTPHCPVYGLAQKCSLHPGMERRCRMLARPRRRRVR